MADNLHDGLGILPVNGKIPLRARFKAWWDGYDLELRKKQQKSVEAPVHEVRYERPKEHWESARLDLAQKVWGEGYSTPGGEKQIRSMIKYFGLDPAYAVMDLGAGLGGAARLMCEQFGVWVTGLEADKELAEAGMALSVKAGMSKKAAISSFDPENFHQKAKSIDCVFSKEFLFTVKDKTTLLRMVELLMKSKGQLLFTDYVLANRHSSAPEIETWKEHEPRKPSPWSVEDYREALTELHFDIRVVEDVTETLYKQVTQGWSGYIGRAKSSGISQELAPALVDEVEIWTRRMQAIDSGELKVCRIHAFKPDTDKTLSDW
jgi:cyclopropane fatty-acyl-phospholipid synthase-like methyltransferase